MNQTSTYIGITYFVSKIDYHCAVVRDFTRKKDVDRLPNLVTGKQSHNLPILVTGKTVSQLLTVDKLHSWKLGCCCICGDSFMRLSPM